MDYLVTGLGSNLHPFAEFLVKEKRWILETAREGYLEINSSVLRIPQKSWKRYQLSLTSGV